MIEDLVFGVLEVKITISTLLLTTSNKTKLGTNKLKTQENQEITNTRGYGSGFTRLGGVYFKKSYD